MCGVVWCVCVCVCACVSVQTYQYALMISRYQQVVVLMQRYFDICACFEVDWTRAMY